MHCVSPEHADSGPQPPQSVESVLSSTHIPAQHDVGGAQAGWQPTQTPPTQASVSGHAFPHVPQSALSSCRSTQTAPQNVPYLQMHAPFTQLSPAEQALPHEPQSYASLWRSMHQGDPAQALVVSPGQTHVPFTQVPG
jgi:hypothetical protein